MSYILEALKKSQQERELGQVPTIQTSAFPADEVVERRNLWILLAVVLAILAVIIAAYAALRDPDRPVPAPAPVPEPVTGAVQAPGIPVVEHPSRDPATPAQPPAATTTPMAPATPASASITPGFGPSRTMPPVPARQPPQAATPAVVEEQAEVPMGPRPPAQGSAPDSEPPVYRDYEATSKVPRDLIADIEAFKRQVSQEQSEAIGAASFESEIAPEDLRLPEDVRKRLPEFLMSAHIYDRDSSKRFVLINGLKTREGEESREEITVEQILPDGAVLSFEGHRFFQRRR